MAQDIGGIHGNSQRTSFFYINVKSVIKLSIRPGNREEILPLSRNLFSASRDRLLSIPSKPYSSLLCMIWIFSVWGLRRKLFLCGVK